MKNAKTVVVVICPPGGRKYEAVCLSNSGEVINTIQVSNIKELEDGGKLISLHEDFYAISGNCYLAGIEKPKSDTTYLINIYNKNKLYKHLMPITQASQIAICMLRSYVSISDFDSNGTAYTAMPLNHIVYKITKDTAQQIFQFIFPSSRVLPNYILKENNQKQIDSTKRNLEMDQNIILSVNNIFYHKNKLFFKLNPRVYISRAGSSSENQYNFIYDTLKGNLFSIERIMTDKMSYYLPLFDQSVKVSGLKYFNDYLFTTLSSLSMFTSKESNKQLGQINYPILLQQYFKTQNRKSNPVIVKMKLKDF